MAAYGDYVFSDPWFEINGDDYGDQALIDGTQLRAVASVEDLLTGSVKYFGVVDDTTDAWVLEEEDADE